MKSGCCLRTRRRFYSLPDHVPARVPSAQPLGFHVLQGILRLEPAAPGEIGKRDALPLGDRNFRGPLLEAVR